MVTRQDLTGQIFGKLTAIKYVKMFQSNAVWLWKCDCGNKKEIRANSVKLQKTRSCGCIGYNWSGLSNHDRALNRIYSNYKYNAQKRELIFKLDKDSFFELIKKPCFYCGSTFTNKLKRKVRKRDYEMLYNGIDRKDSTIGYINGNVVSCCFLCNVMKNQLTIEQFMKQVKKIYNKIT